MSNAAIHVEGLGKQYRLGSYKPYGSLRDTVADAASGAYRWLRRQPSANGGNLVWALSGIDFTIRHGEVVGVIGANGAGKSTLLKILSRVTEPTVGFAEVQGRVGSLLEVGTGFHPELSGRENIYLNGAILGMKRHEIASKFDAIVDFSGVSKFIDTPVKFYSSGMYLRLAFGVAAHFEPEVLVVDEVLAVGDLDFQRRCLGRMSEVARDGRTVLFVSHNLTAISLLTERCILLKGGKVLKIGPTAEVISAYHASITESSRSLLERTDRTGTGVLKFTSIELIDEKTGELTSSVEPGGALRVRLHWLCSEQLDASETELDIRLNDSLGVPLASFSNRFKPWGTGKLPKEGVAECLIPAVPLAAEDYTLDIWAGVRNRQSDYLGSAATFAVRGGDYFGTGQMPLIRKHGGFLIDHEWRWLT